MNASKGVHEGHRKRLMDTVLRVGLNSVSEIQAMEFVLTYIFPRGDVNELAHRLLEKFGSFANVIDADWKEIRKVSGMGDRTAKMLHGLGDLFNYFAEDVLDDKFAFEYRSDVSDYFEQLMRYKPNEMLYIIGVDPASRVKMRYRMNGKLNGEMFDERDIAKFVTAFKPAYLFLAHNHPTSNCKPSEDDLLTIKKAREICADLGLALVDYIIVGSDGVFGAITDTYYSHFKT